MINGESVLPKYIPTENVENLLPAIKITSKFINANESMDIKTASEKIFDYLILNGSTEKNLDSLTVEEITIDEAWNNNKIQIFRIKSENSILYGVAVIKSDEVFMLHNANDVFLADLNDDQKYEVCITSEIGSGIIDRRIMVLDVENLKDYQMEARMSYNFFLEIDIDTQSLIAYRSEYESNNPLENGEADCLGQLFIKDDKLTTEYTFE